MQTTRGATSIGGEDRKKGKGLLWLALAALLLLGIIAAILALNNDDDDEGADAPETSITAPSTTNARAADEDGSGTPSTPSTSASGGAGQGATTAPAGGTGAGGAGGQAGAGSAAASGSVVSGTTPLLPVPAAGLPSFVGRDARGTSAPVESVVADEGFWVGTSPTDRLFVRINVPSESRQQVQAGQRVTFSGRVEQLAQEPAQLGVEAGEGADQLRSQGAYVVADNLQVAG